MNQCVIFCDFVRCYKLNKSVFVCFYINSVVELIGDIILDMCVVVKVDVIVIIFEKWDGIS